MGIESQTSIRAVYPFTAIVDQQEMKLALLLAVIDPALDIGRAKRKPGIQLQHQERENGRSKKNLYH